MEIVTITDSKERVVVVTTIINPVAGLIRVDADPQLAPYFFRKMAEENQPDGSFPNTLLSYPCDLSSVVTFIVHRPGNFNSARFDLPNLLRQWHAEYEANQRIAAQLTAIFPHLNEGSLKRDIINALRRNDRPYAKALCWETDKLPQFGTPAQQLLQSLFARDEEHPWSSLERINNQTE